MSFENHAGIFVVRYDSREALDPALQHDLVAALRLASVKGPVGVVFVVAPSVQMVGREVPEYWMTVTADKGIRLAAMAIVTPNPAVSVATRAFSTVNILRETKVLVKPFAEEGPALDWVRDRLAGKP